MCKSSGEWAERTCSFAAPDCLISCLSPSSTSELRAWQKLLIFFLFGSITKEELQKGDRGRVGVCPSDKLEQNGSFIS